MARSLALRALAGAGAFAASMALSTGWASAAPAAAAGTVSSRTFSAPAQSPGEAWCDFLEWMYGWDVCGANNGGGGGNARTRARQRQRAWAAHDRRAGADHPADGAAGDRQPRRPG